ncbi:40S ribosomal S10b [Brachionus plicatilis]|uniref:40S ribosomal S10b n=1 Tax=Brachionus plicatilis TaxID=10195 RepID=A0A3M7PW64_BRAPC|nr:40S ribosomal S10b [Brachionus plicatilis]
MLMPKKDRTAIYEYLFTEGVMVAEKNFFPVNHPKVNVPNLYVIKALQSLNSRGYVTERFAWQHYYWYLTNEGIQYLREYLHLPPEIVPSTLKKPTKPEARKKPDTQAKPTDEAAPSDREQYRRAPESDKKGEAGAGSYEFKGGFGRGRRPAP